MSHYDWLNQNFELFCKSAGVDDDEHRGLIGAHGDKCYGYRHAWEDAGIPFEHGVAIFLLTYVNPYGKEVRETENGWVNVMQWVLDNYSRFKPFLPPVESK